MKFQPPSHLRTLSGIINTTRRQKYFSFGSGEIGENSFVCFQNHEIKVDEKIFHDLINLSARCESFLAQMNVRGCCEISSSSNDTYRYLATDRVVTVTQCSISHGRIS